MHLGRHVSLDHLAPNHANGDMPAQMSRRFRVALSFPGEQREFIEKVAASLSRRLGQEAVFYDKYYEAELARPDFDVYLGDIYGVQSDLVAPFFCKDYTRKKWCLLEWRNIRQIIFDLEAERVMPFRFDGTKVIGVLPFDGYVSIGSRSPEAVAELIIQRLTGNAPPVEIDHEIREFYSLPITSGLCLGRNAILCRIDSAWIEHTTNVCSLVAAGGVGKTAIVKAWLDTVKAKTPGPLRIYTHSFYHQGALQGRDSQESQSAADEFLSAALDWFGDAKPNEGSSINKADRLAVLIRKEPTVLILDGLEPLQHQVREFRGRIRDKGIRHLLVLLAKQNTGLCLVTSRVAIEDLVEFKGSHAEILVEKLDEVAGRELLKTLGVDGPDQQLENAARELNGHCLALTLLGNLLRRRFNGDVRRRDQLGPLLHDPEQGGHARRVMESYERLLNGSAELDLLSLLGLFNRPAPLDAIRSILGPKGLTRSPSRLIAVRDIFRSLPSRGDVKTWLQVLKLAWFGTIGHLSRNTRDRAAISRAVPSLTSRPGSQIEDAIVNLRDMGLVNPANPAAPDDLDCHPIVREHFGELFERKHPEAWRAAHSRLFEFYSARPLEWQPETLDDLSPLYAAIPHGCRANRHLEAGLVYLHRMLRGSVYSCNDLGAISSDLGLMTFFFDRPWERPASVLNPYQRALVLHWSGTLLATLGRYREGVRALEQAKQLDLAEKRWALAATSSRYLSFLRTTFGELHLAHKEAIVCVKLAEQSGNRYHIVGTHATLGRCLHQMGHFQEARKHFQIAEQAQLVVSPIHETLHSVWGYWYCELLLDLGDFEQALDRSKRALTLAPDQPILAMGKLLDTAVALLGIARATFLSGLKAGSNNHSEASAHFHRAIEAIRIVDHQWLLPQAMLDLADCLLLSGRGAEAKSAIHDAESLWRKDGLKLYEPDHHLGLSDIALGEGATDRTQLELDAATFQIAGMNCHRHDVRLLILRAKLAHYSGDIEGARRIHSSVLDKVRESGNLGVLVRYKSVLAVLRDQS